MPTSATPSVAASGAVTFEALPLRRDADPGFPLAGAVMLIALLAGAGFAWWWARNRRGSNAPVTLARLLGTAQAGTTPDLVVLRSTTLQPGVRLHDVQWAGRRILVAVAAGATVSTIGSMAPAPAQDAKEPA